MQVRVAPAGVEGCVIVNVTAADVGRHGVAAEVLHGNALAEYAKTVPPVEAVGCCVNPIFPAAPTVIGKLSLVAVNAPSAACSV